MNEILSKGTSGNLVIMGMTMYDLEVDKSISITSKELVKQIIEPNGIHIVFQYNALGTENMLNSPYLMV